MTALHSGNPDVLLDPHPWFRTLREDDLIHWDEQLRAWLVTRYENVTAGLYDERLSAAGPTSFMNLFPAGERREFARLRAFYEGWMVFSESPYHEQVRGAVQGAFTPRAVAGRQEAVRRAARAQLDLARHGTVDFYSGFARPLATKVICSVLEIPLDDWETLSRWSRDVIAFIGLPRPEAASARRALAAVDGMTGYVRGFAAELRRRDRRDHPVLAVEPMGETAMVATFAQFLTGGCDPISAGIANAVATLLTHPLQFERLRSDPALIPGAVEECLRYEPPFTHAPRVARHSLTLHGREVAPGARVLLMIAAANRDPKVFADPDVLDITREPNRHLSFSRGEHYCIGAGLARLEMTETIAVIAAHAPDIELAGPVEWTASLGLRCVARLPVTIRR